MDERVITSGSASLSLKHSDGVGDSEAARKAALCLKEIPGFPWF